VCVRAHARFSARERERVRDNLEMRKQLSKEIFCIKFDF